MFAHKVSPVCRFNAKCANKLCQFRHTQNITDDDKTTRKENVEVWPADKSIDQSIEDGIMTQVLNPVTFVAKNLMI